jgi:hypothetical protein
MSETTRESELVYSESHHFVGDLYDSLVHKSNVILNGKEYGYYFYPWISSPLIPDNHQANASIVINGKKFDNILLKYDTYKDLLVYYDPTNLVNSVICPIIVNRHIFDEFSLVVSSGNLRFKFLKIPDNEILRSGYYEIVYDGESKFFIKHLSNKFIKEGRDKYDYKTIRYLMSDAGYFKIKGKRSLLKAFPGHSAEVKKYIKTSGISVRNASKNEILNILNFYDNYQIP